MRINKFTTTQNNCAPGTQQYYNSNKLNLKAHAGLVASYDPGLETDGGDLFSKKKVSKEADKEGKISKEKRK